ncbi:hypothetical protein BTVI_00956 [Pitangus sulphuratus]|nr:hypothetical protein BTVI_00956 [Pitangus sulphuratus]
MPPETSDVSVESTGSGAKTQPKVNAVSTKSTRTGAQTKNQKVIVAPIKRKKTWMETAEPTDPSPRFEPVEEEGGAEGPILSMQAAAEEGVAAMDEGAVDREGDVKKGPKRFPQLEGELFLPLQTQSSFGGVGSPPYVKPTLEGTDDLMRPLSQHPKDYSLPPTIRYGEQHRSSSSWHE